MPLTTSDMMRLAARIAGWLAVIAIVVLSLVPGDLRPHVVTSNKLEHFGAYLVAASLLRIGHTGRQTSLMIAVLLPILAGSLEIGQLWIPGRHARLTDFAVSTLGVWAALTALSLLRRFRPAVNAYSGRRSHWSGSDRK